MLRMAKESENETGGECQNQAVGQLEVMAVL